MPNVKKRWNKWLKRYNIFMPVKTFSLSLSTHGDADIHDITDQIANLISKSGLTSGTATIFCPSSTSALTTIEYESGALSDLRRLFDEIIPSTASTPTTSAGMTATVTATCAPPCLVLRSPFPLWMDN